MQLVSYCGTSLDSGLDGLHRFTGANCHEQRCHQLSAASSTPYGRGAAKKNITAARIPRASARDLMCIQTEQGRETPGGGEMNVSHSISKRAVQIFEL